MAVLDQLNRTVNILKRPQRVISLVPSQTEFLADCGIGERLVGVTKFCIHPLDLKETTSVIGGTKNLNFESIFALNPDLIIANKEENRKEDIQRLEKDFPVWVSDVSDVNSALEMMSSLSEILSLASPVLDFKLMLEEFKNLRKDLGTVAYVIWKDPVMVAGNDTFISKMLELCGFNNVISESRYPELTPSELQQISVDYIFLSSEPFPFRHKHLSEFQELNKGSKVILVDGESFSWYGTRMLKAISYFKKNFYS